MDTNSQTATAPQDLPDELVITLRKPVSLGSETCERLVLREPTAGEVDKAQKAGRGPDGSGTTSDMVLVALVSGVPKPLVALIGYRDFDKAVKYLGGFMGDGPETGGTP